jgi:transcriptional regulator with GAF, ATPase, and Fis domain
MTKKLPRTGPGPSFADIGRAAADAAQREALLSALNDAKWNLSETARTLSMGTPGAVIRAIKRLGLEAEYAGAREAGLIRVGAH